MAKQPPLQRRTQPERSKATTGHLLAAARALFAADGYAATSLDEVVAKAGLTKGALYHHFNGKRDLFAAVFEFEQRELADAIQSAARRKHDPWDAFYAGCKAFFESSLEPGVQRITLLDAPAAIGWERMREIESRYSMALLKNGLQNAIERGRIPERQIDPLAHLLFGAMCEAAMTTARSEDQYSATRQTLCELKALLDGIALG